LPSEFLNLEMEDKAFIIASIKIKIEKEKEEARKIKAKKK
jgi:hypothetical protein